MFLSNFRRIKNISLECNVTIFDIELTSRLGSIIFLNNDFKLVNEFHGVPLFLANDSINLFENNKSYSFRADIRKIRLNNSGKIYILSAINHIDSIKEVDKDIYLQKLLDISSIKEVSNNTNNLLMYLRKTLLNENLQHN